MHRASRSRLRAARRGTTAVEFALVCAPFTIFILAVMGAGLFYYQQQSLDYATQAAVRQVQLGQLPAGQTSADFISQVLCPVFGQFQACTNVFVDLHPVADYEQLTKPGIPDAPGSTATTGFVFCPGKPGQLMYAHIVYLAPMVGGTLFSNTSTGSSAMVANAAFANENPTGLAVVQANGC